MRRWESPRETRWCGEKGKKELGEVQRMFEMRDGIKKPEMNIYIYIPNTDLNFNFSVWGRLL